jgi:dCMP deaminase
LRPDLDTYFMEIAQVVAKRSTCLHRQVGAVLVKDKRILTTGYNGAPAGLPHCLETGCARAEYASGIRPDLCRAIHAEENALIQSALFGISTVGATLYCTLQPCAHCAKLLVNAKIDRIIYRALYPDSGGLDILKQAGIEVIRCPS